MERHHPDLRFSLIIAGYSARLVDRYDKIMARLQALEARVRKSDPKFDIGPMWSVNCSRGRMIFHITAQCVDRMLKSELISIFATIDNKPIDTPRYTWKKAPKLSASTVLSVVN